MSITIYRRCWLYPLPVLQQDICNDIEAAILFIQENVRERHRRKNPRIVKPEEIAENSQLSLDEAIAALNMLAVKGYVRRHQTQLRIEYSVDSDSEIFQL